jgi:hypothetical protein
MHESTEIPQAEARQPHRVQRMPVLGGMLHDCDPYPVVDRFDAVTGTDRGWSLATTTDSTWHDEPGAPIDRRVHLSMGRTEVAEATAQQALGNVDLGPHPY